MPGFLFLLKVFWRLTMDWMKITSGLLLVAMFIYLFPRAKSMMQNSPKGTTHQWLHFLIIIGIITLFVFFLVSIV